MKIPTPAIVTQAGARRFPRYALLVLCGIYVLAGFIGRDGWKSADMVALGMMSELANGSAPWLQPSLMGIPASEPALLPYWLGASLMQIAPAWIATDFIARIPFILLLWFAMMATWYGTYYLARHPQAQPVAFAFGGEAEPKDYARAVADGGVLAFIACLGLAQLSHETTPALAQLGFSALLYYALAALPYSCARPAIAGCIGLFGLSLSGAPVLATVLGLGGAALHRNKNKCHNLSESAAIVALVAINLIVAVMLDMLRWKITLPNRWADWGASWSGFGQLLIWFTWPAWPLAGWTLWRWRKQLLSQHIALPLWFLCVLLVATFTARDADRTLLLALPALATLAAFALPTLKRQVSALIDWFTLLFFSGSALTIWVIWIAIQTGFPPQPAANVARLAPGFTASFSGIALAISCVATLAWLWLVKWRVGRHPAAIWKSLVLPAGGATLSFLLLMTLWMPLLNYAQSYNPLVERTQAHMEHRENIPCVETFDLGQGQIAAFQFYGKLRLKPMQPTPTCPWLLAEPRADLSPPIHPNLLAWTLIATIKHPANVGEAVLLYRRK